LREDLLYCHKELGINMRIIIEIDDKDSSAKVIRSDVADYSKNSSINLETNNAIDAGSAFPWLLMENKEVTNIPTTAFANSTIDAGSFSQTLFNEVHESITEDQYQQSMIITSIETIDAGPSQILKGDSDGEPK
jgi:hypothetical protein